MKDHYELLAAAILEIEDEPTIDPGDEPDLFAEILADLEGGHQPRPQCCGA